MRVLIFLLVLNFGCSSAKRSALAGSGGGAVAGSILGTAIQSHYRRQGAARGVLIGGVLGLAASQWTHKSLVSRDRKTRIKTLLELERFEFGDGLCPESDSDKGLKTKGGCLKTVGGDDVWVVSEKDEGGKYE